MKITLMSLLPCILAPAVATAGSAIHLNSEPGEYIGGGITQTLSDSTGTISLDYTESQLTLGYEDANTYLDMVFSSPDNQVLEEEHYLNAQRNAFKGALRAGLTVSMDHRGCNTIDGDFFVHELDLAAANPVIALDFVQYCGNNDAPLNGSIRINSTLPENLPHPVAVIERPMRQLIDDTHVTLSAEKSYSDSGVIAGYQWEQLNGPTLTLADTNSATPSFTVPSLPLDGEELTLKLTVTDSFGQNNSQTLTLPLVSKSAPLTYMQINSPEGDYIGQGKQLYFDDAFSTFSPSINYDNGVSVHIDDGDNWRADFAAPYNAALQPGNYQAERFPFQSDGVSGLSISGDGRGCNTISGGFTVHSIEQQEDQVDSFMASFSQHCGGTQNPALLGTIALNARHPSVPTANAGPGFSTGQNQTFTLHGQFSSDDSNIAEYQWTLDQPDIDITGADQAVAQFETPNLDANDDDIIITATLTVTDDEGFKDQDSTTITVSYQNSVPQANNDNLSIGYWGWQYLNPLENDTDAENNIDPDSLEITQGPSRGYVENLGDGQLRYFPFFFGNKTDSITYRVKDQAGAWSNTAIITLSH